MKTITKIARLLFCALFICAFSFNSKGQVIGSAFLSGQTNHSGIKVKFIPNSPTARLDSAFTTSSGNYSINLAGGLYQVLLSKVSYQSAYLNNGNAFAIATAATLSNVTLQPGNTVNVTGNVSGNWSANNIYIVNGNITIPAGSSLNIGPGTVIKFNGNYSLVANGTLTANGTSAAPVVFTSNLPNPAPGNWDKIEIKNSASTLNHCLIEFAQTAVRSSNYSATITNCEIRQIDFIGIDCITGSSIISGNKIYGFNGIGIFAGGSGNTIISCNEIYNGGGINPTLSGRGYGIIANGNNIIVRDNYINNIGGANARGISVHGTSSPTIQNNYIINCITGIAVGSSVTPVPKPLIVNNTIVNSSFVGIDFNEFYANGEVVNNIIVNNGIGIRQSNSNNTPDLVAYNLVWNNTNGNYANVQKAGIGQIVTNNSNGDPVDSYFNLSKDPLLLNNSTPAVAVNSPALNAGDPKYSVNIGASTTNCQQIALSVPENKKREHLAFKSFPNPFAETFILNYSLPATTHVNIEIFDLTGKTIERILNETKPQGEHQINYDGKMLRPGMYILKLTSKGFSTHQIIVKQ